MNITKILLIIGFCFLAVQTLIMYGAVKERQKKRVRGRGGNF